MRGNVMFLAALMTSACSLGAVQQRVQIRPADTPSINSGEDAYAAAKRQLALGNIGLAINGFRKAVHDDPRSPDALNGLAVAYDRMGRFDLSRQAYEEALALAPSDKAILHNLQRSLLAQNRLSEAAEVAQELGEAPAMTASAQPDPPAPAAPPAAQDTAHRLERISTQEVALVTGSGRRSWEAVAAAKAAEPTPRPVRTSTGTSREPLRAQSALTRPMAKAGGGAVDIALPDPVARSSPRLVILNGVGRRGLARNVRGFLHDKGWDRASVGDARSRLGASLLVHAPKDRLNALLLARSLPFRSQLVVSDRARAVILLLGRNAMAFDMRLQSAKASGGKAV